MVYSITRSWKIKTEIRVHGIAKATKQMAAEQWEGDGYEPCCIELWQPHTHHKMNEAWRVAESCLGLPVEVSVLEPCFLTPLHPHRQNRLQWMVETC